MSKTILVVVDNTCLNDSRVIKEAMSLADNGHCVHVLCRRLGPDTAVVERNGIKYLHYIKSPLGRRIFDRLKYGLAYTFPQNRRNGLPESDGKNSDTRTVSGVDAKPEDLFSASLYFFLNLMKYPSQPFRIALRSFCLCIPAGRAAMDIRPDIIHVHDLMPLYAGRRAARKTGAKLIYDSHELELHKAGRKGLQRLMAKIHENHVIRHADGVITVCDSIADYLRDRYAIKRPMVLLNTPDLDAVCRDPGDLRRTLDIKPDIPLVVYVGKIANYRGLEQILKALTIWQHGYFAMIGPVEEQVKDRLIGLVDQYELNGRVHFVNSVSPSCVVDFISTADIGLIATQDICLSYRYSLPNKLFEMTLAGLVICASDLPEHRRYLEEFGNGVFMDQSSPSDIARALSTALNNLQSYRPREDKLALIKEKYSWKNQAEKLLQFYNDIA